MSQMNPKFVSTILHFQFNYHTLPVTPLKSFYRVKVKLPPKSAWQKPTEDLAQIILSVIVAQSYFVESGLQHSPLGKVVTYQIIQMKKT